MSKVQGRRSKVITIRTRLRAEAIFLSLLFVLTPFTARASDDCREQGSELPVARTISPLPNELRGTVSPNRRISLPIPYTKIPFEIFYDSLLAGDFYSHQNVEDTGAPSSSLGHLWKINSGLDNRLWIYSSVRSSVPEIMAASLQELLGKTIEFRFENGDVLHFPTEGALTELLEPTDRVEAKRLRVQLGLPPRLGSVKLQLVLSVQLNGRTGHFLGFEEVQLLFTGRRSIQCRQSSDNHAGYRVDFEKVLSDSYFEGKKLLQLTCSEILSPTQKLRASALSYEEGKNLKFLNFSIPYFGQGRFIYEDRKNYASQFHVGNIGGSAEPVGLRFEYDDESEQSNQELHRIYLLHNIGNGTLQEDLLYSISYHIMENGSESTFVKEVKNELLQTREQFCFDKHGIIRTYQDAENNRFTYVFSKHSASVSSESGELTERYTDGALVERKSFAAGKILSHEIITGNPPERVLDNITGEEHSIQYEDKGLPVLQEIRFAGKTIYRKEVKEFDPYFQPKRIQLTERGVRTDLSMEYSDDGLIEGYSKQTGNHFTSVHYNRDPDTRLVQSILRDGQSVLSYEYKEGDLIEKVTDLYGDSHTYGYQAGQLLSIKDTFGSYLYQASNFDRYGNPLKVTSSDRTKLYKAFDWRTGTPVGVVETRMNGVTIQESFEAPMIQPGINGSVSLRSETPLGSSFEQYGIAGGNVERFEIGGVLLANRYGVVPR